MSQIENVYKKRLDVLQEEILDQKKSIVKLNDDIMRNNINGATKSRRDLKIAIVSSFVFSFLLFSIIAAGFETIHDIFTGKALKEEHLLQNKYEQLYDFLNNGSIGLAHEDKLIYTEITKTNMETNKKLSLTNKSIESAKHNTKKDLELLKSDNITINEKLVNLTNDSNTYISILNNIGKIVKLHDKKIKPILLRDRGDLVTLSLNDETEGASKKKYFAKLMEENINKIRERARLAIYTEVNSQLEKTYTPIIISELTNNYSANLASIINKNIELKSIKNIEAIVLEIITSDMLTVNASITGSNPIKVRNVP
jgi:hypothetical protein